MTPLIAAAIVFMLVHLLVSGTRLRGAIVGVIGEAPYLGLFSLASLGLIVWLSLAYAAARGMGEVYWAVPAWGRWAQAAIQLVAMLFIITGLLIPNPTIVKLEGMVDKPVTGMLRITRHPFLWGVFIWAAGHLLLNGDTPSIILFGAMAVIAVSGTYSIDAKRRAKLGPAWDAFVAQTSNIPFAAIAQGRQPLRILEIGWWRLLLGVLAWAGLLYGHQLAFGVSAIP
jgi:uncharacterized membrane protein